jgi:23S rRNA (cytidine2498-2'-O)-methyltransferase
MLTVTQNAALTPDRLLLYCRAGFEPDLAAEVAERAEALGWDGAPEADAMAGYVNYRVDDGQPVNPLHRELHLGTLVFARQSLVGLVRCGTRRPTPTTARPWRA